MRHVFLSPHPDDAVWSCGGRIAALRAAGRDVTLVSCFTGDAEPPSAACPLQAWREVARPSLRRAEDERAALGLRVGLVQLGLVDAALRRGPGTWLYRGVDDLFGRPAPEDAELVERLAALLAEPLARAERVYVPLAVSSHVDHVLVRAAARRHVPTAALRYYEEFPYPAPTPPPPLVARTLPVPLEAWLRAALVYRSQVAALFGSPARFRSALVDWAGARGRAIDQPAGQRLWVEQAVR